MNISIVQVDSPLRLAASKGAAVNNGRYTCTATNFIQPTGRQRYPLMQSISITKVFTNVERPFCYSFGLFAVSMISIRKVFSTLIFTYVE